MSDADILFERYGSLGLVTLNRPGALNALTHAMALALEGQLDAWRADASIAAVAIRGAGDKAFCAGGDIRALYEAGRPGGDRGAANFQFYADEYRVNTKIKTYPKPYVALMDGIVMGGGVGVSIHGSRRIAGDRTLFAMPETGIGLFPDVGGTFFLPRMPGQTGMFAGLTGARFKTADAVAAGVCDTYVESARHAALIEALAAIEPGSGAPAALDEAIAALATLAPGETPVADARPMIDRFFAGDSVEQILDALDADGGDWAAGQAALIRSKSPTCTRIAFRQIREGAKLGFEDCMRLEYRLARFCMMQPDFYEGVRAVIIDKDNAPKWSPATLAEADDAHVAPGFAPLGRDELVL
ncbi:enoyl-CoA hydratase/isomerase family protein [Limibaculum sp. M0105]|uniref:3-hydroxyisobutyryl-CoA hydrolase n=1 Tax=Thermohalobaculum xanthum TaxID=2753746 RepID=A0A8J7M3X4_9RHOB|nr:enoyl-CoA hydratase/isomerase family protein [Thermohalobaculum xanthum]MBK0397748.1 enoyl-CoA hydratase/isomerase family protein [Thermohalobaculum xanthum]